MSMLTFVSLLESAGINIDEPNSIIGRYFYHDPIKGIYVAYLENTETWVYCNNATKSNTLGDVMD